jgi:hypothetical protein
MIDVLNSVLIKHDTNFKSLTKIALSQVILKIIYENSNQGILVKAIRSKIDEYTGTTFAIKDLEDSIQYLRNQGKVHAKEAKYFIKSDFKKSLDETVNRSEQLNKRVLEKWFSNCETAKKEDGINIINEWFNKLMISFFKEYRFDWINDLKQKAINGKKNKYNIGSLLTGSFLKSKISESDYVWLSKQFVGFLESSDIEDNELLWGYGSSMFSATLLTAKNYADDFSIEMFRDSYFVLDTNILMTLGLEGHELHYAFLPIERVFLELKIKPIYFYISREEYRRAIARKRTATFEVLDKFGYKVVKESDCGIIQTAIGRQCRTKDDFTQFFKGIEEVPEYFCDTIKLEQSDYLELHEAIENGRLDENTQTTLNDITYSRARYYKSKNVLEHDSGLIQGTLFLNKTRKSWILTKDGALRQYANKTKLRDDDPIAIGLDSFIQMMAINSGNIEENATNFAPLFAKIIQFSLLLEKDIFKVEDLYFILDTKIDIQQLKHPEIIEIAKKVNHLRLQDTPEDEIALEIRRFFQKSKVDYEAFEQKAKSDIFKLEEENRRAVGKLTALSKELFESKYFTARKKFRREIAVNWTKLIGIPSAIAGLILFILLNINTLSNLISVLSSISIEIIGILISLWKFKLKLRFNRNDKVQLEKLILHDIENINDKD